jgi:hypothetical protein
MTQCYRCSSAIDAGGLVNHLIQDCSQTSSDNQSEYRVPIKFSNVPELIQFAKDFIVENKIASLENDVERCLPHNKSENTCYAPFPALLYCFSVIDLLGALLEGKAIGGNTAENSRKYMECYMDYSPGIPMLMQKIFRHKLVHLSQPCPGMIYNGQILFWEANDRDPSKHNTLENLNHQLFYQGNSYSVFQFILSVRSLTKDIKDSVIRLPNGYLDDLAKDQNLRKNFNRAINQIFDPLVS